MLSGRRIEPYNAHLSVHWYDISFHPSFTSFFYITANHSHSRPMVANQAYTMIRAILSVSVLVHDTPENTGFLSCLGPFQMTGSLPVPQFVASPWFSPSRPKAEVSSFCTGSLPWETLPLIYLRFLLLPFIFAFPADGFLAAVFVSERVSISFSRFYLDYIGPLSF